MWGQQASLSAEIQVGSTLEPWDLRIAGGCLLVSSFLADSAAYRQWRRIEEPYSYKMHGNGSHATARKADIEEA